jgi:hypothetical protein
MCTVDDISGGLPCLRLARWRWDPIEDHPVFLCNFHAEPLLATAGAFEAVSSDG